MSNSHTKTTSHVAQQDRAPGLVRETRVRIPSCGPFHHFRAGGYCPLCNQSLRPDRSTFGDVTRLSTSEDGFDSRTVRHITDEEQNHG